MRHCAVSLSPTSMVRKLPVVHTAYSAYAARYQSVLGLGTDLKPLWPSLYESRPPTSKHARKSTDNGRR